jgi:CheY-specific phosphatase CheX
MPETRFESALRDSVQEVLEKMFFVEPVEEPPGDVESPDGEMAVQLKFEGLPSGAVTLRVTTAAALQIAADFLGEDASELPSAKVEEVVCELTNMICGSVLSRVESSATFRLGSPRILVAEERRNRQEAAHHRAVHAVSIGSGTVTVSMETRDPACLPVEESVS